YKSNHAKKELIHISEKINAIAALHQQLYLSVDKGKVSLKNYFSSIEQNFRIGLIQDSVDFSIETDDIEIPTDKAVYIGLLITELIINSLKHAFENTSSKAIKIR